MPGCCLPLVIRRRLPQRIFRGSITRPTDPLCTLRSLGYPRTTQHSVSAASTLCRVELFTYWVPQRSFYFLLEASPPSRLCLAHITQLNLLFLMPQSMKVLARCGIQPKRKPYDFPHVPMFIMADKALLTIRPLLLLGLRDGDRGSN